MGGILVLMMLWAMTLLSARMLVLSWMPATVSINLATNPLVSSSLATTSWRLAKGQCEKTQIHVYLKIVSVEEKRHPGEQLRFTTIFTSHSLS